MAEDHETNKPDNRSVPLPARPSERFPLPTVQPPHPAVIAADQLMKQCDLRTQPRGGPGGQHRNRTSSGVFLHHRSSGITGEATERRSQSQNRSVAMTRLRFRLAMDIRTPSVLDFPAYEEEASVRDRFRGHSLRTSDENEAKPGVLALLLNDLHASGGQPSLVADLWTVSTSRIVALLKSNGPAFALVNQIRKHHGRRPLK